MPSRVEDAGFVVGGVYERVIGRCKELHQQDPTGTARLANDEEKKKGQFEDESG